MTSNAVKSIMAASPPSLSDILARVWGLTDIKLTRIIAGKTNHSFMVTGADRPFVLRQSWPGKPQAQIECEARVLNHLHGVRLPFAVPKAHRTLAGEPYGLDDNGCWLHLFQFIPGSTEPSGQATDNMRCAMQALARLHGALATLPCHDSGATHWLQERFKRVSKRPRPKTLPAPASTYRTVLDRIEGFVYGHVLETGEPAQWLHGDYHYRNLLFLERCIHGIVDFDGVGTGARHLELAFALFALSRDIRHEDRLAFDVELWELGLETYARHAPGIDPAFMRTIQPKLLQLFCADQVLIHLEAVQHQLWTLKEGIGFWGCWHHLE